MGAWSPCRSPGAPTFRPVHDSCCYSGTTWSNLISAGCLPHDDFSAGSRAAGLATNVANHRPGRPDQPGRGRDDALDPGRSQCAGQAIPCRSGLINGPEGGDLTTMGLDPLADRGCVHGQGWALHLSGFRGDGTDFHAAGTHVHANESTLVHSWNLLVHLSAPTQQWRHRPEEIHGFVVIMLVIHATP